MNCSVCGHDNPEDAQFCEGCGASLSASTVSGTGTASSELPMVSFPKAIKLGFKNYANFSGRARRSEYWWFLLFTQLMWFITWVPIIGWAAGLAIIIPGVSATSRRLHDIGKSGRWLLMPGVPVMISVLSLITYLGFMGRYFQEEPPAWVESLGLASVIVAGVLGVVAIVAAIVLMVWLARKGDERASKYGPDPRQATSQQAYKP